MCPTLICQERIMFEKHHVVVEALESRRMLSAAAAASVSTRGVCHVAGTAGADDITINLRGSRLLVTVNGQTTALDARKVHRVVADGGDGNDSIAAFDVHARHAVKLS